MSVTREETMLRKEWDGDKAEISKLINVKSRRIMLSVYSGKVICACLLAKCRVNPNARKSKTTTPVVAKPKFVVNPPAAAAAAAVTPMLTNTAVAPNGTPREAMAMDEEPLEIQGSLEIPQRMVTEPTIPSRSPSMTEVLRSATPVEISPRRLPMTTEKPMATEKPKQPPQPQYNFVPSTIHDYEIDYALTDKRFRGLGLGSLCTELMLNVLFSKAHNIFVGGEELEWYDRGTKYYLPDWQSPVFKYWDRLGFKKCTVEEFGHDEMDHIPFRMTLEEYKARPKKAMYKLVNKILIKLGSPEFLKRLPKSRAPRECKVRISTPWLGDFWIDANSLDNLFWPRHERE